MFNRLKGSNPSILLNCSIIILVIIGVFRLFFLALHQDMTSNDVLLYINLLDFKESGIDFLTGWTSVPNLLFTDFPYYLFTDLFTSVTFPYIGYISAVIALFSLFYIFILTQQAIRWQSALIVLMVALGCTVPAIQWLVKPAVNTGTFNNTLLSLLFIIGLFSQSTVTQKYWVKVLMSIGLFFLIVLSMLSNLFYFYLFVIPVLISLIYVFTRLKIGSSQKPLLLSLILGAAVSGWLCIIYSKPWFGFNIDYHPLVLSSLSQAQFNLRTLLNVLDDFFLIKFWTIPIMGIVLFRFFSLVVCVFALLHGFRSIFVEKRTIPLLIKTYLLVMAIILSITFVLDSSIKGHENGYYLVPLLFVYAFWISLSLESIKNKLCHSILLIWIFMWVILGLSQTFVQPLPVQHHTGISNLLQSKNLQNGYSSYWHTHVITGITNNQVKVRPVQYDKENQAFRPFMENSQTHWLSAPYAQESTFLIVPYISPYTEKDEYGLLFLEDTPITASFGVPCTTYHYANPLNSEIYIIYVWPYNIGSKLKI